MSSYYNFHHATQPTPAPVSHNHHGGRNRRAPRLSVSQNSHKQFRGVRSMKELNDSAALSAFRIKFEAAQSFDLEDDMEFCPGLLSDMEMGYMSGSERSSMAGSSPESSPTQHPMSVAPTFSLNSSSPPFVPPAFLSQQSSSLKLHQPSATRARGNAIPIINPLTGITMASPPPSVSPARMQQTMSRRW